MNATGASQGARCDATGRVRAVIYARTATTDSTESIERQYESAARYAARHNLDVVRTYADIGKSGSAVEGRAEMKRLLKDVTSSDRDFAVILIYDWSRWGRFLDIDEAAYCERLCRRAGVDIHICSEQSANGIYSTRELAAAIRRSVAHYDRVRFPRSRRCNLRRPSRPVSQNNEWRRPWKRHFRGLR